MIFVTVGNALQPFDRLIRAVDEAMGRGELSGDVLIQLGHCAYRPRYGRSVQFLDGATFEKTLSEAEAVVAHAGVGTILQCIRARKIPVVVPRRRAHGEIVDDHQIEICEELERAGRVHYVRDINELSQKIRLALETRPSVTVSSCRLHFELRQYLRSLAQAHGLVSPEEWGAPDQCP